MKVLKSKLLWTVVIIVALVLAFIALVPKGISMNLEEVGKGKKSVVFIYDPNLGVSNQQSSEINKAREVIGEEAAFVIAQVGDPRSKNFRDSYEARSAELLFFNETGKLINRKIAPLSSGELLRELSK